MGSKALSGALPDVCETTVTDSELVKYQLGLMQLDPGSTRFHFEGNPNESWQFDSGQIQSDVRQPQIIPQHIVELISRLGFACVLSDSHVSDSNTSSS